MLRMRLQLNHLTEIVIKNSMDKIFLFGASDHCKYTIDIIEQEKKYEIAGIFDYQLEKGSFFYGYEILGYLHDLAEIAAKLKASAGIVAIGDNYTRSKLAAEIHAIVPDFQFVNAVHPSVILGKNSTLGKGCVIMAGVIINNDCKVGDHVFLATKCSVDHDSTVGDYSSLSPGVVTGGRVSIGYCTAIGIGATILHYTAIGSNSVVGAASLVNKTVGDNAVVYGVPAKFIKSRNENDKYL
jgi:sugar O-acyltransferase (sialic acid O-acetyltransferase NeuD family)